MKTLAPPLLRIVAHRRSLLTAIFSLTVESQSRSSGSGSALQRRCAVAAIAFHIDIGSIGGKLLGMKAYTLDLRERVVKFVAGGGTRAGARLFRFGERTVYRYLAAAKTNNLPPRTSWGHWRKLDPDQLAAHVATTPTPRSRNCKGFLASAITPCGSASGNWASR